MQPLKYPAFHLGRGCICKGDGKYATVSPRIMKNPRKVEGSQGMGLA
jgi:hypothetical protein